MLSRTRGREAPPDCDAMTRRESDQGERLLSGPQRAVTLSSVTTFVKNKPGLLAPRLVTTTTDDSILSQFARRPRHRGRRPADVAFCSCGLGLAAVPARLLVPSRTPLCRPRLGRPLHVAGNKTLSSPHSMRTGSTYAQHGTSPLATGMPCEWLDQRRYAARQGTLSSETNDPIDQTALSSAFSLSVSAASGTAPLIIAPCSMLIAAAQHTGTHGLALGKQRNFPS